MYTVLAIGLGLLLAAGVIRIIEKSLIYLPPRYPLGFHPPGKYVFLSRRCGFGRWMACG
jgi:hypothetical protein